MEKKSQASIIIAAIFVILAIALVLFAIILLLLRPSFNLFTVEKSPEKTIKVEERYYEPLCSPPYIKVGNSCCLDKNYNGICDNDESQESEKTSETSCNYPYIKKGNSCCLDDNDNRICDRDEDYYDNSRSISAYLNNPFHLSDIDVKKDELRLEIKNEGDEDYIIKTIDIDDCDRIHPDKAISKNDRKVFYLDCDFPRYTDSDIEIEYSKINSSTTLASTGRIRERPDYRDYYDY